MSMVMLNLRGLGTEDVALYVRLPGYEVKYPATKEIEDYMARVTENPGQLNFTELDGLLQPVKDAAQGKLIDEGRMQSW